MEGSYSARKILLFGALCLSILSASIITFDAIQLGKSNEGSLKKCLNTVRELVSQRSKKQPGLTEKLRDEPSRKEDKREEKVWAETQQNVRKAAEHFTAQENALISELITKLEELIKELEAQEELIKELEAQKISCNEKAVPAVTLPGFSGPAGSSPATSSLLPEPQSQSPTVVSEIRHAKINEKVGCLNFVNQHILLDKEEVYTNAATSILLEKYFGGQIEGKGGSCPENQKQSREVLHNGLCLGSLCKCGEKRTPAAQWPPQQRYDIFTHTPEPPFLHYKDPPKPIPPGGYEQYSQFCFEQALNGHGIRDITTGRQLFLDNFLIRRMSSGVERVFPKAKWVNTKVNVDFQVGDYSPYPYGSSVLWNNETRKYMMWLRPGFSVQESLDGVEWGDPFATNMGKTEKRDSTSIWIDPFETDPAKKFKAVMFVPTSEKMRHMTSPDGKVWTVVKKPSLGFVQDASTVAMNPFRKKWIYHLKTNYMTMVRVQAYHEVDMLPSSNFGDQQYGLGPCPLLDCTKFDMDPYRKWKALGCLIEPPSENYAPNSVGAPIFIYADNADANFVNDPLDKLSEPEYYIPKRQTDIYFSVSFPYESLMLNFRAVHSQWNSMAPKVHFVHLSWSLDGFHYTRVPAPPGQKKRDKYGLLDLETMPEMYEKLKIKRSRWLEWKPVGGGPVIQGDNMLLYMAPIGFDPVWTDEDSRTSRDHYHQIHFGYTVWKMRRDGFAFLRAKGEEETIITEILTMGSHKRYLFLNVEPEPESFTEVSTHTVRVRIDDANGKEILPYSNPMTNNSTMQMVRWQNFPLDAFSRCQEKNFVLSFKLTRFRIYSFWASNCLSGESDGWSSKGQDTNRNCRDK